MHRTVFGAKCYDPEPQAFMGSDMIGSCRWLGRCHLKMGLCPPHLVLLIGPAQRGLSESSEPFRVTVPKRLSFFFTAPVKLSKSETIPIGVIGLPIQDGFRSSIHTTSVCRES